MLKGYIETRHGGQLEEVGFLGTAILSMIASQLPGDVLWTAVFYTAGGMLGLSCMLQLRGMAIVSGHDTPNWQRAANALRHLAFLMLAGYVTYDSCLVMSRDGSLLLV
jgi:hypothetical protein